MRKTLLSTLVVALLLSISMPCPAQPPAAGALKPLVTVSFSGYDELRTDVTSMIAEAGKVATLPDNIKGFVAGMATMIPPNEALPGLDVKKPWGVVVRTDGMQFSQLGFIPVTDLKKVLPLLAAGGLKVDDNGDGTYTVTTPFMPLQLKESGGWAFVSDKAAGLANLPADPTALLGGLNEKYNLGVRAFVKNVPAMFRQMFVAQLQLGVQSQMKQLPGESDEDYALRSALTKRGLDQMVTAVNDLDNVMLGWNIDPTAGTSYFDFEVTAMEGTTSAAQYAAMAKAKTNYAGFDLPGAALTGNWAYAISADAAEQAKGDLAKLRDRMLTQLKDQGLTGEEIAVATMIVNDLWSVVEATIDGKRADGGMVVMAKPDGVTVAAGGVLAEGAKLDKTLKQLAAQILKDSPELKPMLQLDAETHEGVAFHKVTIPMPDEDIQPFVGEQLVAIIGIGDGSLYLSAGKEAAAVLKQVIDKSKAEPGKDIPLMRISLAGTPIAKFAANVAEGEAKGFAAMIAAILEGTGGKDHVNVTVKSITNGVSMRLEIEKGILTALPILAPKPAMGGGKPVEMGVPGDVPAGGDPF